MTECIRIEMPNGEVYEVPLADAAERLARNKYPDDDAQFNDEKTYYEEVPSEAEQDLPNHLNWEDIEDVAVRVSNPNIDYQSQFVESELRVVERDL